MRRIPVLLTRVPPRVPATLARVGLLAALVNLASAGLHDRDAEGWTVFNASSDSRLIYVNRQTGDDHTARDYTSAEVDDPFQPGDIRAYCTVAAARARLRDTFPDWILFHRGDVWEESLGQLNLSGRSDEEPMLFGAYGDLSAPRPEFQTGDNNFLSAFPGDSPYGNAFSNHLAFVSLSARAHTRDPDDPAFTHEPSGGAPGWIWVRPATGILLEDMRLAFFPGLIAFHAAGGDRGITIRDLTVRRNVLTDSYRTGGHVQGLYISSTAGLLLEENVIDYNGWREGVANTLHERLLSHDLYLQFQNEPGSTIVRGNIITRASSHGLQLRSGGVISNNYFAQNPLHLFNRGDFHAAVVNDNVLQENVDIHASEGVEPRGLAVEVYDLHPDYAHEVKRNIISHDHSGRYNSYAIRVSRDSASLMGEPESDYHRSWPSYAHHLTIADNIVFQHRGAIHLLAETIDNIAVTGNRIYNPDFDSAVVSESGSEAHSDLRFADNIYYSAASPVNRFQLDGANLDFPAWVQLHGEIDSTFTPIKFPDPDRTAATYAGTLGLEPTFEAFITEARLQRKGHWREALTARAINNYVRAGFGRPVFNLRNAP